MRHSPDGFNWGYQHSGPADLAGSLLADCLGTDPAPRLYQAFKERFIAPLAQDAAWCIDKAAIRQWLDSTIRCSGARVPAPTVVDSGRL